MESLHGFILHEGLVAAGGSGLDFSRLGTAVPEPSTVALLVVFLGGLVLNLRAVVRA